MYKNKKVIIYGIGRDFYKNKNFLEQYFQVIGYSDQKSIDIDGYIEPNKICRVEYEYIYISSVVFFEKIKIQLIEIYGISENKVIGEIDLWKNEIKSTNFQDNVMAVDIGNVRYSTVRTYDKIYATAPKNLSLLPKTGPEIYNRDGIKMETFFIREMTFGKYVYWSSKYFLWDRFNCGLDTHFYSNYSILETMGNPSRKYGFFIEPKSIIPEAYDMVEKNPDLISQFDLFFTFEEKILNKFSNARFAPFAAESWYGKTYKGKEKIKDNYKNKTKNISMIASNKDMCEGHRRRKNIALKCKKQQLADTYGRFDGGEYLEAIEDALEKYRYSIVMENESSSYYFSEKITSCFAAQTVPIYFGAAKIQEFFNPDGIITLSLNDLDNIEKILQQCNEKDYESRIPAILDNYHRVQRYNNIWDNLYEDYLL